MCLQGLAVAWADGELEPGPGGQGCGREAVLLEEHVQSTWTRLEEICGAGSMERLPVRGGELRLTYLAQGPLYPGPRRRGAFMKLVGE